MKAVLSLGLALVATGAFAQAAGPPAGDALHFSRWGEAIQTAPCNAFRRNKDGSWTQAATIILGAGTGGLLAGNVFKDVRDPQGGPGAGVSVVNGVVARNTFRNTLETSVLDQRCGAPTAGGAP